MQRPGWFSYLFGNMAVMAAVLILLAVAGMKYQAGDSGQIVFIILLGVALLASNAARGRVMRYRLLTREWNETAGKAAPRPSTMSRPFNVVYAIIVWGLFALAVPFLWGVADYFSVQYTGRKLPTPFAWFPDLPSFETSDVPLPILTSVVAFMLAALAVSAFIGRRRKSAAARSLPVKPDRADRWDGTVQVVIKPPGR